MPTILLHARFAPRSIYLKRSERMNDSLRLFLVVLCAAFVNVGLFSAIAHMTARDKVRLTKSPDIELANFIRLDESSADVRSRRDARAPAKPRADVERDMRTLAKASSGTMGDLSFSTPDFDIDAGLDLGSDIRIARELTPLVRIPPDYPPRAGANRIEGYVILRFVVTESGAVADPEVLRSEPEGVFERAAKRAVLRWKYQPQIRNGEPVSVMTMTRLTFKLMQAADGA